MSGRWDRVKIFTWDNGGFVLVYKRLGRGQCELPHLDSSSMSVEIDATQLAKLLDGIDFGPFGGRSMASPAQSDRPASRRAYDEGARRSRRARDHRAA